MKKFVTLLFVTVMLTSCEEKGDQHRAGKLDTIIQEVYSEEENELCRYSISEGKKNGAFMCFYGQSDTIKIKGLFTNGKKDGEWMYYHPNGNVDLIQHYFNDTVLGDLYDYDIKENLYAYRFYGPHQTLIYGLDYENGEKIDSFGNYPFYASSPNEVPYKINEEIVFDLRIGILPGYSSRLLFLEKTGQGRYQSIELEEGRIPGSYMVKRKYKEEGKYTELFVCEFQSNNSGTKRLDTAFIDIDVQAF